MRKAILIQILVNLLFSVVAALVILGTMVSIKYNYDDPVAHMPAQVSQDMYDLVSKYGVIVFIALLMNIAFSFFILRKLPKNKAIIP